MSLKKIDIDILKALQRNASINIKELAKQLGLSDSSCWRRVKQLEDQGMIKRHVALLDRERLGFEVVVFTMVSLVTQSGDALDQFERIISRFPEVLECYTMTGEMDYLLKVVAKDMRSYEQFARNHLAQIPNIREMHSHVAVTRIKDTLALPL